MTRQAVILDMAYNLGISGVLMFKKMWAEIGRAYFRAAADEMLDSKWAKQVGDRADRLASIMATDSLE
jgi:lysozyme